MPDAAGRARPSPDAIVGWGMKKKLDIGLDQLGPRADLVVGIRGLPQPQVAERLPGNVVGAVFVGLGGAQGDAVVGQGGHHPVEERVPADGNQTLVGVVGERGQAVGDAGGQNDGLHGRSVPARRGSAALAGPRP